MKLQLSGEYARLLRAIGQDLQGLFPESLEIEVSGRDFVARGCGRSSPSTPKHIKERGVLRNIWRKLNQPSHKTNVSPLQPSHIKFERRYTTDDIDQLDKMAAARRRDAVRKDTAEKPDLYSLQERLRMIGRIVDDKKVELVKIHQEANTVTFEFRDVQGEIHSEEYSTLAFYKLQQQYYSERSLEPENPWQRIRARG